MKWIIIVLILAILIIAIFLMVEYNQQHTEQTITSLTQTTTTTATIPIDLNCSSFSYENCPNECVVCPPCYVCSSVSCQTEEFCKSIGFDRNWYNTTVFHKR